MNKVHFYMHRNRTDCPAPLWVVQLSYEIGGKDEIAKKIYFVVHKKRVSVWI